MLYVSQTLEGDRKMDRNIRRLPLLFLGAALFHAPSAWAAFDISFDYTYDSNNFFADSTRKSILESAAGYFESIIKDDLLAIESSGVNNFTASFFNPSNPNDTVTISNFDVAADTITIFVGSTQLGNSTLGLGGYGGYSVSGTSTFVDNAITRGETPTTSGVRGATATDFALWGGSISFNIGANWYFDADPSTNESFNGYDFYSVALHEIGHVLGIGMADSWDNKVNGSNQFTGTNAVAAYGAPVPLNPTGGHWADGTQSTVDGAPQEAAMDPTISSGTRKQFTELDVAALEDIGWETSSASP